MTAKDSNLSQILKQLIEAGDDSKKTNVGELVEHFESRGYGSLLAFPALIALLPTGAIPGVPTACGTLIFLISIQLLLGRSSPWLPKKLREISIKQSSLEKSVNKALPVTQRIDKVFSPRFEFLQTPHFKKFIALCCALAGLLMIPLELLPFAVAIPASAILFTAMGLTTEDGVFIIVGLGLCVFSIISTAGLIF